MCEILDFKLQVMGNGNSQSVLGAASDKSLHAQGGKMCPATHPKELALPFALTHVLVPIMPSIATGLTLGLFIKEALPIYINC